MRLDHIAYRVANRHKTIQFFMNAFDYKVQTEFEIKFENGSVAKCFALEPPEKSNAINAFSIPWEINHPCSPIAWGHTECLKQQEANKNAIIKYHLAPEIFVSDGTPDSIVGKWVEKRDGIGGIHHLAYQVDSVESIMEEWKSKGYAEFTTEKPLTCPELTQIFTKPSELTGVIYEFITRGKHGFCIENVQDLMLSTNNLS